jgi:single-strand DNA-binding protein
MNKVFLIGNLTRDPELTETPSGVAVCRFSIAVNRSYSSQDGERQTDFFNCTAWRGQAETIARYTKKGNKVAVSGSIQLRNYEDNQGVKRTAVDIVVQDVEFLTPKTGEGFDEFDAAPRSAAPAKKKPALKALDDDDSDIPF